MILQSYTECIEKIQIHTAQGWLFSEYLTFICLETNPIFTKGLNISYAALMYFIVWGNILFHFWRHQMHFSSPASSTYLYNPNKTQPDSMWKCANIQTSDPAHSTARKGNVHTFSKACSKARRVTLILRWFLQTFTSMGPEDSKGIHLEYAA